jgi:hypothetical protein
MTGGATSGGQILCEAIELDVLFILGPGDIVSRCDQDFIESPHDVCTRKARRAGELDNVV